jgi:hypothetical protein
MTDGIISPPEFIHESPAAIMLCELDFPKKFRGIFGKSKFAHPEDYEIDEKPIKP